MRAVTRAIGMRRRLPPGPILELGCGAGSLVAQIQADYPQTTTYGLELNPLALAYGRGRHTGTLNLIQADLQQLPIADHSVGTLIALDVFDQHGVDLDRSLNEGQRVLREGGHLLLRVSAHPQLASQHDHLFNTARRYTRPTIVNALYRAGFELLEITYANGLLSIPVAALRLLQQRQIVELSERDYTRVWINHLLSGVLEWEARWLAYHDLPFGLSLYVLARADKRCTLSPKGGA